MNLRANPTLQFKPFADFESRFVPRLMKAAGAGANAVLQASQELCPVQSGDLRASGSTTVEWKGTRVVGWVSYSAHHAAFVEFGTGLTGRGTYPFNLPVTGVPITGSWIYDYKQQNWVGMVSRPFLRPALDTSRPAVLAAFSAALGL